MVGLPMVIFTILFASWSLERDPEMHALGELARKYIPVFIVVYLAAKCADMIWRGTWSYLLDGSYEGVLWMLELALPLVALGMYLTPRVRRAPRLLGAASLLVILSVVLNRLSVFVLAFHPPYSSKTYIPSLTEFMVSMGLVAALLLVYRVMLTYLPILEPRLKAVTA
jgi:Ni/Fe-hydrogenase subunit HybB-like protein